MTDFKDKLVEQLDQAADEARNALEEQAQIHNKRKEKFGAETKALLDVMTEFGNRLEGDHGENFSLEVKPTEIFAMKRFSAQKPQSVFSVKLEGNDIKSSKYDALPYANKETFDCEIDGNNMSDAMNRFAVWVSRVYPVESSQTLLDVITEKGVEINKDVIGHLNRVIDEENRIEEIGRHRDQVLEPIQNMISFLDGQEVSENIELKLSNGRHSAFNGMKWNKCTKLITAGRKYTNDLVSFDVDSNGDVLMVKGDGLDEKPVKVTLKDAMQEVVNIVTDRYPEVAEDFANKISNANLGLEEAKAAQGELKALDTSFLEPKQKPKKRLVDLAKKIPGLGKR